MSNQTPPTKFELLSPMPMGGENSVTSGSLRAGDWADPIRAGPWTTGGALTPPRKRRMFLTSLVASRRSATPASRAHGCGSPKIAPAPI
jgi:hypothetical protein